MHAWNEFFDGMYCLNLASRPDRMDGMERRFKYFGLKVERANALSGAIIKPLYDAFYQTNKYFTTPNYLACAIGHVQMYATALARKQKSIFVIEDDVRIHRNSDAMTRKAFKDLPSDWDLLYFVHVDVRTCGWLW